MYLPCNCMQMAHDLMPLRPNLGEVFESLHSQWGQTSIFVSPQLCSIT